MVVTRVAPTPKFGLVRECAQSMPVDRNMRGTVLSSWTLLLLLGRLALVFAIRNAQFGDAEAAASPPAGCAHAPNMRPHAHHYRAARSLSLPYTQPQACNTSDAQVPVQLMIVRRSCRVSIIEPVADSTKLRVNEEGLRLLRSMPGKLAPVVVIGPYRSGKSFLINQMLGTSCGAHCNRRVDVCASTQSEHPSLAATCQRQM